METFLARLRTFRAKFSTEPFLFLYMFATAVHYPLIPVLLISKACHQAYNKTVCSNLQMIAYKHEEKVVYVHATGWNTLYAVVHFIPALVFILPFGSLSDLVSKKKLLMIPALALLLQSVTFAFCAFYQSLPIALLLLGGSLPGFHGSAQGTIALSNSYMADRIPANGNPNADGNPFGTISFGVGVWYIFCGGCVSSTGHWDDFYHQQCNLLC
eukprot:Seg1095.20 transcript_id=Seg1095.20/GoldUCD/mRNA.D3Y31 product="Proton-coupled folate transporter" protein_id=Seg1095.20/GoldUCD/D3Y31